MQSSVNDLISEKSLVPTLSLDLTFQYCVPSPRMPLILSNVPNCVVLISGDEKSALLSTSISYLTVSPSGSTTEDHDKMGPLLRIAPLAGEINDGIGGSSLDVMPVPGTDDVENFPSYAITFQKYILPGSRFIIFLVFTVEILYSGERKFELSSIIT